ncbi:MAG TPA: aminoacetone oxidase family FAD-binding enzyme [Candidatus Yonathbacteria bacterium]|nr:aminoacetone oxidase family FAD-binding enzyme [Candidatus Yonathbacteria bacterium]
METTDTKKELFCDVAVIGGGPAGMMAAIRAAELGANVILIEKNEKLGKKLLITGGGRCNVTNATFDNRELAQKYGKKGKFLLSPLSQWNSQNTINFFETRDMPTKVEAESRAFPKSNSAQSVLEVLEEDLQKYKVSILLKSPVIKIHRVKNLISNIETSREIIHATSYIITTGGTARPETGSTGDGFVWLKKIGHKIVVPDAALVPVKIAELWVKKLQGLSFPEVKITLFENSMRREGKTGKILFTHFGLSGPLVLNMSRTIGEAMRESKVTLSLDLFPALDHRELDEKLRAHLSTAQNKRWQNALKGFLPPLLVPIAVELSKINPQLFVNKVPREVRLSFVKLLKDLRITPTGLLGPEKAIVSSGGVALEEVDFKTMRSLKTDNLYLAGDILDFDRPSGGFSLQICWTTGFVAGTAAAQKNTENR